MRDERVDLTLIVCTYRRPEQIKELLHALEKQTLPPGEILIIDGSEDEDTQTVVENYVSVSTAQCIAYHRVPPEQRGLTRQRNFGIALAKGGITAFLDDDTIPEPDYFAEIMGCFARHPEAVGVGGYITNEDQWHPCVPEQKIPMGMFRHGRWERRDDLRWRLRKLLGLDSPLPPGWMPAFGHARSTGCIPPDGQDHHVECVIGCSCAWKTSLLHQLGFSTFFEGYGLYEDLDFCLRASRKGAIYLCTAARLAHYHAPSGRPNQFRYGMMVVRNGWYVWRVRYPRPAVSARLKWWSVTVLLAFCRLLDVRSGQRKRAFTEAMGRFYAMGCLVFVQPSHSEQGGVKGRQSQ